jgi:hypothetical protein
VGSSSKGIARTGKVRERSVHRNGTCEACRVTVQQTETTDADQHSWSHTTRVLVRSRHVFHTDTHAPLNFEQGDASRWGWPWDRIRINQITFNYNAAITSTPDPVVQIWMP